MSRARINNHRKLEGRQVVTALGILLLTFGLLGWQWQAFNQRNAAAITESQAGDPREDAPPPNTHWHEAPKGVRLAVAGSIRGQLRAFDSGQYEAGLEYHTRTVRQGMASTENYRQLIQVRYPFFARHKRETFRFVNTDKERRFANAGLSIITVDGAVTEVVYQLVFQDKQWLISAIAPRSPQPPSTPRKAKPLAAM
ncbi:MAG TPA: DUF4864 domain-containing protein [Abditibacteriaceae bacterium]